MDPPTEGLGGGIVIHPVDVRIRPRLDPWPGVTRPSGSYLWILWILWIHHERPVRAARAAFSGGGRATTE